ncbi:hypothetical protein FVEN_g2315 [Fusarium venenatum]|nr:hypothetical protein FVEN_g2315 [Fusarium venenatum]
MTDSAEVERLMEQVTLFQKRASELSIEREELDTRLKEVSSERDEHCQELKSHISALQHTLSGAKTALTICVQAEKKLKEANERYTASEAEHTAKLNEVEKSLSACQTELRVTNAERNLLHVRWKDEKAKSAALVKEVDDLKLDIDLERNIKDTIPTSVRDELKQALKAEQREVKRLNTKLEDAQRSFQATTSMPQAERDRLYESLGAEKNKVLNFTRDRDEGDNILVRCDRCRTRHWHD